MYLSYVLYTVVGLAAAFALYAWRTHRNGKQAAEALISKLTFEGTKIEKGLLDKLLALENGGHLAAGTTQQLVQSQLSTGPTNGGQPPATSTAATV